jgi:ribosomal protein S18 acetylase RimI-like enzyme
LVELRDSIAAEGELIAAAPGDRSVVEEELALAAILSQGGLSLTLEVDGEVAGHLLVRRLYGRLDTDTAEIAIAVHNSARGAGLGRALMETAIDWARAVRLSKLSLGVFPSNSRAIRLYRSLGFVDETLVPQPVALPIGTRELLLMGLTL